MENIKCIFHAKSHSLNFWVEVINIATYILKKTWNRVLSGKNPLKARLREKLDINHMRFFRSITYVHIPKKIWEKLDSKSFKCIFLGYGQESKAYKLWDVDKNQVVMSRNVFFNEEGNLTTSTCKVNSSPSVTISHNYLDWFR